MVDTAGVPQSASVTLLHWKPALSLKNINAFFFSWNSIAKEKKGSRTEVEGSVLSKDNATFMGKQADMESASLKRLLETIYSMIGIVVAYKQRIPRDLETIRKNRILCPSVF